MDSNHLEKLADDTRSEKGQGSELAGDRLDEKQTADLFLSAGEAQKDDEIMSREPVARLLREMR